MDNTEIIKSISKAIYEHFDKPDIYIETPEQGYRHPYFFIKLLNTEQKPDAHRKFNREYFFDIRYHPDKSKTSRYLELIKVEEGLRECLYLVNTDTFFIRAIRFNTEVADGVLHLFVTYPFRVYQPYPVTPDMETLEQIHHLKPHKED